MFTVALMNVLCTGAVHADLLTKVIKDVMTAEQKESFWRYYTRTGKRSWAVLFLYRLSDSRPAVAYN